VYRDKFFIRPLSGGDQMRILVAESDPALGTFLRRGFEAERYGVDLTADGEQAKSFARERKYEAAVLDVQQPQDTGLDVLREVRARQPQLPILILASRTRAEERAQMLDLGADDLMLKPFAFSELSARLRALLRRGARAPETVLRVDDLELNRIDHSVKRAGRKIDLTPKEFSLLEYLMRNAGTRVTRAQIIENVWNLNFDTTSSSISTAPPSAAPSSISTTRCFPAATSSWAIPNRSTAFTKSFSSSTFPAPPRISASRILLPQEVTDEVAARRISAHPHALATRHAYHSLDFDFRPSGPRYASRSARNRKSHRNDFA
jgi:DNA-binding response OmpR family regulator